MGPKMVNILTDRSDEDDGCEVGDEEGKDSGWVKIGKSRQVKRQLWGLQ
jgi:hypothetical protein